ncbi:hypothetical protein [Roseovarius nanhaiticus]|uniref:hypothetical protein n=1 Tax=Roseovarius nanhaiticus TaxID=573024 RepID=UPI00249028DC|nr:hypothetical protein [Roseovarius nanhaiticus]
MDLPLILILAGATFALVIVFVLWSKRATEKRMEEHSEPKSTLAKDKDSKGNPADVK